jgi:hypothetical protein
MRAPPALVDCFFIAYSTIIPAPFLAYYITFVSGKLSSEEGLLFYLKEQPK